MLDISINFGVLLILMFIDLFFILKHQDKSDASIILRIVFGLFTNLFTLLSLSELPFSPYFATLLIIIGILTIGSIWFKGKGG